MNLLLSNSILLLISVFTVTGNEQKRKIGLLAASLPWTFGPYQAQMHKLSLQLSSKYGDDNSSNNDVEYEIYWICHTETNRFKPGVYHSWEELRPHAPNVNPPPKDFPLDHLNFIGYHDAGDEFSVSKINRISKENGLDCFVSLMDITKVVPDEDFDLAAIAWAPLHSATVRKTSVDYWVLRKYHGIAGLAPSGVKAINDAVGREIGTLVLEDPSTDKILKESAGTSEVEFIPHVIDRKSIVSSGKIGLKMLEEASSVAEADSKLTNRPIINRGQESSLESGHSRSLFSDKRKDDFIVLLQGGNYEEHDRKGWDTSIQAFVRFYNSLKDPTGIHLLIHSMESYLMAAEENLDKDAPGAALPLGMKLHLHLHNHGLPRDVYTLDIARHAPEVVAAYKTRADVCLHPSKVEGFGMNVMECQAVGTPVITTNYTAMADFTKLGRSVTPRQMIQSPDVIYEMAMPDVIGIADALSEIYQEHLALKKGDEMALSRRQKNVEETNQWIDATFSPTTVGRSFHSLLLRANQEFLKRTSAKQLIHRLSSTNLPSSGAYKISSGYHAAIVDWDTPWTLLAPDGLIILSPQALHQFCWKILWSDKSGQETKALVVPTKYENGTPVPMMDNGSLHNDQPVLVKTYMVKVFQGKASRRKSIAQMALQVSPHVKTIPEGVAVLRRGESSAFLNDEL